MCKSASPVSSECAEGYQIWDTPINTCETYRCANGDCTDVNVCSCYEGGKATSTCNDDNDYALDNAMQVKNVSAKLDGMATSVISLFVIKDRVEATEAVLPQISARVLKDGVALPAILLFVLLHVVIVDNALVQKHAHVQKY